MDKYCLRAVPSKYHFLKMYPESCLRNFQTSVMELFAQKRLIIDVAQSPKYASVIK